LASTSRARAIRRRINLAKGFRGRGRALAHELSFWEDWLDRPGVNVADRLDPALTDPTVLSCLSRINRKQVAIIDVGAGPLSTLGTQAPRKQISLVAVDPLAADYARMLRERGITPLVRTQFGQGEDLVEQFEPGGTTSPLPKTPLITPRTRSQSSKT
jgi:hypothetical protein